MTSTWPRRPPLGRPGRCHRGDREVTADHHLGADPAGPDRGSPSPPERPEVCGPRCPAVGLAPAGGPDTEPDPRAEDLDAQEAIDALWPECDAAVLEEIAGRQRMRATYARVAANR